MKGGANCCLGMKAIMAILTSRCPLWDSSLHIFVRFLSQQHPWSIHSSFG